MSDVERIAALRPSMETPTVESILDDLGGCGLFQILVSFLVHGSTMSAALTLIFMMYGNYNPGWTCADEDIYNTSYVSIGHNGSFYYNESTPRSSNKTDSCEEYKLCKNVVFSDDSSTILTQWNLACDKTWVTSLMISLQMVGVLVGVLSGGHINAYFGRKVTLYGTLLLNAALNLVAIFSVNWPMYAVIRCLLGFAGGSIYLSAYVYPIEFITSNWRGVVSALPITSSSTVIFTVGAMIMRDWKMLHLATVIITLLWLLPVFWAPESLRWLAIKGKVEQAVKVGRKIARTNKTYKTLNTDIIVAVAKYERDKEKKKSFYSYADLYRNGLFPRTFIISFTWLSFTFVYYAIVFGISSLSGNFYVNMIIYSVISTAPYPLIPLLTNTVGRRFGIILLLSLSIVCCAGLVAVRFNTEHVDEGLATNILSLSLVILIEMAWVILILNAVELYPTVLRSHGYSHASSVGRLGGMIAPFMIADDQRSSYVTYLVMGALILMTSVLTFFLPETKGRHMPDSVARGKDEQEPEEENVVEA